MPNPSPQQQQPNHRPKQLAPPHQPLSLTATCVHTKRAKARRARRSAVVVIPRVPGVVKETEYTTNAAARAK